MEKTMRWFDFLALAATATSGRTALQEAHMEVTPISVQLRQIEWQRSVILEMIDAMPAEHFRDSVTPEQRDFADQLFHAAMVSEFLCEMGILDEAPAPPETDTFRGDAESLKGYITASYGRCEELLADLTEEKHAEVIQPFGGSGMPRGELLDQGYLHAAMTLGQVVANFRKHGMAPPPFPPF